MLTTDYSMRSASLYITRTCICSCIFGITSTSILIIATIASISPTIIITSTSSIRFAITPRTIYITRRLILSTITRADILTCTPLRICWNTVTFINCTSYILIRLTTTTSCFIWRTLTLTRTSVIFILWRTNYITSTVWITTTITRLTWTISRITSTIKLIPLLFTFI